jgi:colanic acid/amylovoran biosynthesis glycosyltransferase
MRVAIFSGGIVTPTFIQRLINGLSESDTEIVIFGNENGPVPNYHKKVTLYPNPKGVKGHLIFVSRFLKALFVCFSRVKQYAVYQKNWPWSSVDAWKTWQRHLPVILYLPNIFHLQWALGTEYWIFLKKLYGVKFVVSLRGAHINYSPLFDPNLKIAYQQSFPLVDAFHAVSKAIGTETCLYGATSNQINVIYSGLNLADFSFTPKNGINKNASIKIISVGRPHWKKGYRYALDTIKILVDKGYNIQYTIVGGLSAEQWHQCHQLKMNNIVQVIDRLPFNEVKERITACDILLLPSVEEGIANVVLEAMALGTLVVSSNCGGMEEAVHDGRTGFVFPLRDVNAMVACLEKAITLPDEAYLTITKEARQLIEKQHTLPNLIQRMKKLYASL